MEDPTEATGRSTEAADRGLDEAAGADSPEPNRATGERVVVLNPVAGSGDHEVEVRSRAAERGFDVLETSEEEGATPLAERAAETASLVAACGGDGTINEVVRGLVRADALAETTLGVVPAGTGNNFADKIGVESIAHGFDVMDAGERRRVDLGTAAADGGTSERPFVNSCICGVTAEASADTDHDQKNRIGTLAYLFNTLREAQAFDPIPLRVEAGDEIEPTWDGEVIAVLVGNGRRFPTEGTAQANMEDGLLEVTILEDGPTLDIVGEEARRRFLEADGEHVTRFRTSALDVAVEDDESASFSLDGEMLDARDLALAVEQGRLELCVGAAYDPNPDE